MSTIVTRAGKGTPLTHNEVAQLLRYEPDTGKLFWLVRHPSMFSAGVRSAEWSAAKWNTRYAGKEAFTTVSANGYKQGKILGDGQQAHRLMWLLQTGEWPEADVDHINGVRTDNRWTNLRAATRAENNRNRVSHRIATSRFLGVCWAQREGKWRATIKAHDGLKHIGYFDSEEAAAHAYDQWAMDKHGEFARPNFKSEAA